MHPVAATVERNGRVEETHFGIPRDRPERDVWRVRDHDIDRAIELEKSCGEVDEYRTGIVGVDPGKVLLRPDE